MEWGNRVSLTSHWYIKAGHEEVVLAAINDLVPEVKAREPGTLTYLVHTPFRQDDRLQSLPPTGENLLLFFEEYEDADAFQAHLHGPSFTSFVDEFGDSFRQMGGKPYASATFLTRHAGFVRFTADSADIDGAMDIRAAHQQSGNSHPSVMFEVMARDQASAKAFYNQVFDWNFDDGKEGFAYIHFPSASPPLLGGIGQSMQGVSGMEAGTNFYLLVKDLNTYLDRATKAGGTVLMPPTTVDNYNFAMFCDPEGFAIGLVTPFNN